MSSWRRRVLEQRRDEITRWLEAEDASERTIDEVDTAQRTNWLEAVQEWEPGASLPEELVIRLMGGSTGNGALRFAVGNALLKPLQDGVTVSTSEDVDLELVGLSSGSTVLHVRPVVKPSENVAEASEGRQDSVAGEAIHFLMDAMTALEERDDVAEWTPMLSSMSALVSALDRFDLSVQLRWLSAGGEVRSSCLTESGRSYVRQLRKTHSEAFVPVRKVISGLVTELKLAGTATIKPVSSPAVVVKFEPGQITESALQLGEYVNLLVEERRRLTTHGAKKPTTDYLFVQPTEDSTEFLEDLPAVSLRPMTQVESPGDGSEAVGG